MLVIDGYTVLVDIDDLPNLLGKKWKVRKFSGKLYVVCYANKPNISLMHRLLLGLKYGDRLEVDHRNGNGLDNRRCNLRICTHQENLMNQNKQKNRSSSYKGVSFYRKTGKWRASIKLNKQQISLGYYKTETVAAYVYNYAAKSLFGEFAKTNEGLCHV